MPCCSNIICNGCDYANLIRELKGSLEMKCAFCRHPRISDEELEQNLMKRVKASDSAAMCQIGGYRRNEGITSLHFKITQKQLNWAMLMRIIC